MAARTTQRPPQKVRTIKCPVPLAYTSGGVDSQPIPGGMTLRELKLTLRYSLATGAVPLAAAAIMPGAEWGVVKKLRILAGTEIIKEFTGEELVRYNAIWYGKLPRPGLVLGGNPTAVASTLLLPFWDQRSTRSIDTMLNTSKATYRIEVTWGTHTDVASSGTAITAATLEWNMEASTGYGGTLLETRVQRMIVTPAVQTGFPIVLQTGLVAIRRLGIYAKTAAGLDDPGKIGALVLKSLNTNLIESAFDTERDQAYIRAGLRETLATSAPVSPFQETSADMDAWCFIDFCKGGQEGGYLSECFPTFRLSDLRLLLDVTAAIGSIVVVAEFVIPPPSAQG